MERLFQELRYAARRLLRTPGFTAAAVLSLGLGIGANTTLYTWVRAVLIEPIPGVREPGQLVMVSGQDPRLGSISLSYPDYLDYRQSPAVAGLLAQDELPLSLGVDGRFARAWGLVVSENYFEVLGVDAALGRTFRSADGENPGPVVVISDAYWRARFGADPAVIGRAVTLNTLPFTIIGVTPPGFRGSVVGLALDAFVPVRAVEALVGRDDVTQRGSRWLAALARLRPGTSIAEAEAGLGVTAQQLAAAHRENRDRGVRVFPFWSPSTGGGKELGAVLRALSGVVAVVLLIACANVAGLLLARGAGRQREIAVRLSLGASRARVVGQLLAESVMLAVLAGAAGILFAAWGTHLITAFAPPTDLPIALTPRLDGGALLFTLALSFATALLFGLVPALQSTRPDVAPALRDQSGTVTGGRARARARAALVVGQVALSLLLLVSAGLLVRSLRNALDAPVGFEPDGAVIASVDLGANGYTPQAGRAFVAEALARLRALPGVSAATATRRAPLGFGGRNSSTLLVEGHAAPEDDPAWSFVHTGGSDYVRTLGATLLRGRDFQERDTADAPRVVLVNETMAQRYWPGREALGGRVRWLGEWHTVVGVVKDIRHHRVNERGAAHLYASTAQAYGRQVTFVVRGEAAPEAVLASATGVLRGLDPALPVYNTMRLRDWVEASTFQQRMAGTLLAVFGALALALATIGLYALLAYTVGQRTREFGIRMALGGAREDIFRMVVRQGLRLAALGVAIGVGAAALATRGLSALLVDVGPLDPATYAAVVAALAAVALAAAAIPARRASSVEPAVALHQD